MNAERRKVIRAVQLEITKLRMVVLKLKVDEFGLASNLPLNHKIGEKGKKMRGVSDNLNDADTMLLNSSEFLERAAE